MAAGKLVIGAPGWSDQATLTASNERSGFPVTNLQTQRPSDRWESTGVASVLSLNLDRGSIEPFSLVALVHHNGSKFGGWRLRAARNSVGEIETAPVYDSTYGLGAFLHTAHEHSQFGVAQDASWTNLDFTLAVWIAPDHPYAHSVVRRAGGTNQPEIRVNELGFIQATDVPNENHTLTSTTRVSTTQWTHVALTYDAGTTTAKLLINGVEEDSDASVNTWDVGDTISVAPTGGVERYTGRLLEPRFWSVARSESQVAADMFRALDGTEPNLLGAWNFDNMSGAQVSNSVAGGPNMAFSEAPGAPGVYRGYSRPLRTTDDRDAFSWHDAYYHDPIGIAARYVQIDILDPQNADGRFRMGRLFISPAQQLTRWLLAGSDLSRLVDESPEVRTGLGIYSGIHQAPRRDLRMNVHSEERWEVNTLEELYRLRGKTKDIVCIRAPGAQFRSEEQFMHGLFTREFGIEHVAHTYFRTTLRVREL